MKKKAVFLDRDGVLNRTIFRMGKERAPYTLEEFELLEGVEEGVRLLKENGFLTIVVTNQPDVARGWVSREAVEALHLRLQELLPLDDIKICYHTEKDACPCRKPRPGMLLEAAEERGIDLSRSFMVGDRESDVAAGKAAGCKTILVGQNLEGQGATPHYKSDSLLKAIPWMLQGSLTD